MATKQCNKCKEYRTLDNFSKDKSKKDGFRTICTPCGKQYIKNNKKRIRERQQKYYQDNKENIYLVHEKYVKDNKEKILEKQRQYREDNKEKRKKSFKSWYEKNKEYHRNWKLNNKHLVRQYNSNRRARKMSQLGFLPDNYIEILEQYDTHCRYCNLDLRTNQYHIDHIIPLSRGGMHDFTNMQLICPTCNFSKGSKTHIEFIKVQK